MKTPMFLVVGGLLASSAIAEDNYSVGDTVATSVVIIDAKHSIEDSSSSEMEQPEEIRVLTDEEIEVWKNQIVRELTAQFVREQKNSSQ